MAALPIRANEFAMKSETCTAGEIPLSTAGTGAVKVPSALLNVAWNPALSSYMIARLPNTAPPSPITARRKLPELRDLHHDGIADGVRRRTELSERHQNRVGSDTLCSVPVYFQRVAPALRLTHCLLEKEVRRVLGKVLPTDSALVLERQRLSSGWRRGVKQDDVSARRHAADGAQTGRSEELRTFAEVVLRLILDDLSRGR